MYNTKLLCKKLLFFFLRIISCFFPKKRTVWFCIPDLSFINQDLLNYTQDSIYGFLHYVIDTYHEDLPLKIYLVCNNNFRINEMNKLANSNIKIELCFIKYFKRFSLSSIFNIINYYFNFYFSGIIITFDPFQRFPMKLRRQIQICISYYSNPTKNDFKHNPKIDNVNYIITSADISAKIDSHASHIPYSRYHVLGIPKEDYIIKPRFAREEIWKKLKLNNSIKKIILYCPTHKDYERKTEERRNIFGYEGDYTSLNMLLEERSAVLIIRLHPGQELNVITYVTGFSNILLYEDSYEYTLCDIIPHTDILITDYSTTAFDFMLTKNPIIYNFYDFDTYQDKRGFAYDPFELVCTGPIVKTKCDLENEITYQLDFVDNRYKEKYNWVNSLVHKYDDGNASRRIYQFVCQLMNERK
jgi:hypothetical protein